MNYWWLLFAVIIATIYKPILYEIIWKLYIWQGYYTFLFHYKYMFPPNDGHNISSEFRALATSTAAHRLLFPPPIDENEWVDYFRWVTDDAMQVYVSIPNKCLISSSSHLSSIENKASLWIIGDKLASNLNKYNSSNSRTILLVHGGAFVIGSSTTFHGISCHLSNFLKMRVLLIDYELTPEYSLPTPLNTIYDAYMFLINKMKVNSNDIIVNGDSAGATLTIWLLERLLKNNDPQPKGAILMSPWIDITCSTPAWMQKTTNFDAIPSRANTYRNALWMMSNSTETMEKMRIENVELKGLITKFFVTVGENEVLYEEVMNFKKVCQNKYGIDWNDMIKPYVMHDWPFLVNVIPEAEEAMIEISKFVNAEWFSEN